MKNLTLVFCIVTMTGFIASAETQIMHDSGSAALAKALGGRKVICGPSAKSTQEKGFFPLTVSATDLGQGKTQLSVTTSDPKVGFGFGGTEFDATEISENWVHISCGDDGRRYLFIQNLDRADGCDEKNLAKGVVRGDSAGLLSEIWDAGTITSEGVQCCTKNR